MDKHWRLKAKSENWITSYELFYCAYVLLTNKLKVMSEKFAKTWIQFKIGS